MNNIHVFGFAEHIKDNKTISGALMSKAIKPANTAPGVANGARLLKIAGFANSKSLPVDKMQSTVIVTVKT